MTAEFIIRLILAVIACGAIGMERQMRGKGAGLRTHVLIGMGSALFMIVSKYGFADVLSLGHVGLDPSRIAAQVVTGVGVIGAGKILVRNQNIVGL
ncbi:Mg2+ transporter-C family protein, partial [Escherichia coli MS 60-1]|uniref:MgtC/SapB family protein n=1 Tax=Escherichia coli TaxID=562 RepID=UPI0001FB47CA